MQAKSEDIYSENRQAIIKEISKLDVVSYETVSELLPRLLAEGLLSLNHSVYTPADPTTVEGIGRYLVYDHPDETNPFSIWTFAFAPKQKTSIHDHQYKGTVTVLEGPLTEKFYLPTGGNSAQRVERTERQKYHSNSDDLNGFFAHQLKHCKPPGLKEDIKGEAKEEAKQKTCVSFHIYKMAAGQQADQRNLKKLYFKNKSVDKGTTSSKEEDSELNNQSYTP